MKKVISLIFPHYTTVGHVTDIDVERNILYVTTERGDVFPYKNKTHKEYWIGFFLSDIVVRVSKTGDFIASI